MSYKLRTERTEYRCLICNHSQYDINNICLKCGAKHEMYRRFRCKKCERMVEGDNIHVKDKTTGQTQCKYCKSEYSRKASLKYYHMKKLRGELN